MKEVIQIEAEPSNFEIYENELVLFTQVWCAIEPDSLLLFRQRDTRGLLVKAHRLRSSRGSSSQKIHSMVGNQSHRRSDSPPTKNRKQGCFSRHLATQPVASQSCMGQTRQEVACRSHIFRSLQNFLDVKHEKLISSPRSPRYSCSTCFGCFVPATRPGWWG